MRCGCRRCIEALESVSCTSSTHIALPNHWSLLLRRDERNCNRQTILSWTYLATLLVLSWLSSTLSWPSWPLIRWAWPCSSSISCAWLPFDICSSNVGLWLERVSSNPLKNGWTGERKINVKKLTEGREDLNEISAPARGQKKKFIRR